jgi:hypothetical protein
VSRLATTEKQRLSFRIAEFSRFSVVAGIRTPRADDADSFPGSFVVHVRCLLRTFQSRDPDIHSILIRQFIVTADAASHAERALAAIKSLALQRDCTVLTTNGHNIYCLF